jgi:hypothetical protein
MKSILIIISIISLNINHIKSQVNSTTSITFDDFADFRNRFNKTYASVSEQFKRWLEKLNYSNRVLTFFFFRDARKQIFQTNLLYVIKHNLDASKGKFSYRLAMNQYGDLVIKLFYFKELFFSWIFFLDWFWI